MTEKQRVVKEIQKLASRLFNEEIMKLHYNYKRLGQHPTSALYDLEGWLEREVKNANK
jgi:hypothetical protein